MRCKRVRKLLTAYKDGELGEENQRSVSEHLAACERCREYASEVSNVLAWAGMWRAREPSPMFLARVKARARAPEEPPGAWHPLQVLRPRRVLVGVAAACMVFLCGYLVGLSFSGRQRASAPGLSVAQSPPDTGKGTTPEEIIADRGDSERLIVGVQKIKMIFGSKLSDAAYAQLNEVQRALSAREGEPAERSLAVVEELQRAEEFIRERKFAEARFVLASLEQSYAGHPLVPYARMTKMLTMPEPGYGSDLLESVYATLLQGTVIEPTEFYNQVASFQAQVTEYGWQKIRETAGRLNPLSALGYIEKRLGGESTAL
ncbi:MAG: zf-HC2 domain-containing protein [Acidobacteriota bacterium]